jgi:hypothetical protein
VLAIPCTTYRQGKRVYVTQILIAAPEGGLSADAIALAEHSSRHSYRNSPETAPLEK